MNKLHKVSTFGSKAPSPPAYIQYKGVWDMQDLFESVVDFLRNQKFKFQEKLILSKTPSPYGRERKYQWNAWKKKEEYYEYGVDIYLHSYDVNDIDVKLPDGTTKQYQKGRLWIQIMCHISVDYDKRWDKNLFFAQLGAFYNKYVVEKKLEAIWWDEMHYKVALKLRNLIQQRLKMESEEFENRYFAGVH